MPKLKLPRWIVPVRKLVHSPKVHYWCALPYPGHPKGCPYFDKRDECPTRTPHVTEVYDLTRPMYFVYNEFDLEAHIERMRAKHPGWSERQLRNVLYWQRTSKKEVGRRARMAIEMLKVDCIYHRPEAIGINMYATARHSGLKLEKIRNLKICRHIILLGWHKEK